MIGLAALLAALAATPGAAADWRAAREVELRLAPNDIMPGRVRLRAGEPVRLRVVNTTFAAYRLDAPALFARALRPLRQRADDTAFVVAAGETRELLLVPPRGAYRLHSTSLMRRVLGVRAEIIVE